MKVITKLFEKLSSAERFQNSLYEKYGRVLLVRSPLFSEEGMYIWEVE